MWGNAGDEVLKDYARVPFIIVRSGRPALPVSPPTVLTRLCISVGVRGGQFGNYNFREPGERPLPGRHFDRLDDLLWPGANAEYLQAVSEFTGLWWPVADSCFRP